MRYRAEGGSDTGLFFGACVMLFIAWQSAVAAGYLLGALIADPRQVGLDLVMPVFFAAMLVPLWRGPRPALAWAAAGGVALGVQHFIGGWWFIVAGAIARQRVRGHRRSRVTADGARSPRSWQWRLRPTRCAPVDSG